MAQNRPYDIVVYGATGFTGERVALYLATTAKSQKVTFALAGRSEERLAKLRQRIAQQTGGGGEPPGVLIADVSDSDGLLRCFKQARVCINCVGPFRFLGEPVVAACIDAGCHYVDVTGEPQFMDNMALKYTSAAIDKEVVVVHACGFDSIPADLGVVFCEQQLRRSYPNGALSSVESYLHGHVDPKLGGCGHFATYECIVHGISDRKELASIRSKLRRTPERQRSVPRAGPIVRLMKAPRSLSALQLPGFAVPFPGADSATVRNSQCLITSLKGRTHPLPHFAAYVVIPSLKSLVVLGFLSVIIATMAQFHLGRRLLLAWPRLFTLGAFSHQGPTEAQIAGSSGTLTFVGRGYKEPQPDGSFSPSAKPDVAIRAKISMPELGYVATPICAVQAAFVILQERDRVGLKGGVVTPAVAFGETTLIERLTANGVQFSVEKLTTV